ncbi:MAG: alpha/beta fold hydrolase [Luteibaculaceae bacterium]
MENFLQTKRLKQHYLHRKGAGKNILFIHGNGSNAGFWKSLMHALPADFNAVAVDVRGYGKTEPKPIDATKSFHDVVLDIQELVEALELTNLHLVGHSLGGIIALDYWLNQPKTIESITLVNPGSPFGFGGTYDANGKLTSPDGAGSGAGIVNPEFVKLCKEKYTGTDFQASPLNVMNQFYWEPPFIPNQINELLSGLFEMQIGDNFYPGDFTPSDTFPYSIPGVYGPLNAASPIYRKNILEKIENCSPKPPILWVRGDADKIVSDNSLFDIAVHGEAGLIPGYPGVKQFPTQPMVEQTRYCLTRYHFKGGSFKEIVMEGCGHSPYIEREEAFITHFVPFINQS